MGGWRDTEGRTAQERRGINDAAARARFADTLKHRPLSLLKGLAGFVFVMLLVAALIFALN